MFEEPQNLAADLGGIAKDRGAPAWAVGAVGQMRGLGGALGLSAQRLDVPATVLPEGVVQQDRDQHAGDDGQAQLGVDGIDVLAPSLGLGEVVFPGVEALLDTPSLKPL